MKPKTDSPETSATSPGSAPQTTPGDLKTLPLAEVRKTLGASPDGLTQAEAQARLTQYGPNELAEKKANALLKFLSYFWGPIPWMIEAAVVLSAVARHWPDFGIILAAAGGQRRGRILGRTPGRRCHRRTQGQAGDQGAGQARRPLDQHRGARAGAGRPHPSAPGRHRAGGCPPAGGRPGGGGPVRAHRGIPAGHPPVRGRCLLGLDRPHRRDRRIGVRHRVRTPISAGPPNWWARRTASAIFSARCCGSAII